MYNWYSTSRGHWAICKYVPQYKICIAFDTQPHFQDLFKEDDQLDKSTKMYPHERSQQCCSKIKIGESKWLTIGNGLN